MVKPCLKETKILQVGKNVKMFKEPETNLKANILVIYHSGCCSNTSCIVCEDTMLKLIVSGANLKNELKKKQKYLFTSNIERVNRPKKVSTKPSSANK